LYLADKKETKLVPCAAQFSRNACKSVSISENSASEKFSIRLIDPNFGSSDLQMVDILFFLNFRILDFYI
jgi:hypothetical protein